MTTFRRPKIIAIIPARYQSSRLPGKPLLEIAGISLIQRVYTNIEKCRLIDTLLVATDDKRIFDHVTSFGGKAVMTSEECRNGTERVEEAVSLLEDIDPEDIILNIQGDEPLLESGIVEAVAKALEESDSLMSTAIYPLDSARASDPGTVKCVVDLNGNALYFSRSPIPVHGSFYGHIGIYGFRRHFLSTYRKLASTPLEQAEKLEQLKVLEHGYPIKTVLVQESGIGVDTMEDLKQVEKYLCKQSTSSSPEESAPRLEKV